MIHPCRRQVAPLGLHQSVFTTRDGQRQCDKRLLSPTRSFHSSGMNQSIVKPIIYLLIMYVLEVVVV